MVHVYPTSSVLLSTVLFSVAPKPVVIDPIIIQDPSLAPGTCQLCLISLLPFPVKFLEVSMLAVSKAFPVILRQTHCYQAFV